MLRFLCTGLIATVLAFGQFSNLVTTDDGSVLIFSSTLKLAGTSELPYSKLFIIDSAGLRLYQQRDQAPGPPGYPPVTNYYNLVRAELSGNGAVVAIIGRRDCGVGSGCVPVARYASEIFGVPGQGTLVLSGQVSLSRDGRYAAVFCDGSALSVNQLADLYTGIRISAASPFFCPGTGRIVSSSGAAVTQVTNGFGIQTLTGNRTFTTPDSPAQAIIDDQAKSVVYLAAIPAAGGGWSLNRVDLVTGAQQRLVSGASDLALAGMTSDSNVIAYLSGGQLFTVRSDGTGIHQLTHDTAGLKEATLAGNGTVAFAVTAAGRLQRIEVPSGAVTDLIGRTVTISLPANSPAAVAGSAFCVSGSGFTDTSAPASAPLPLTLGGTQLLLDGQPVPLQSVTPSQICLQIPWETSTATHTLHVATNTGTQFWGGSLP